MADWETHTPNTRSETYSEEDIEEALGRVYGQITGKLTTEKYKKYKKDSDPSVSTIANRFDGWVDAKETIGVAGDSESTKKGLQEYESEPVVSDDDDGESTTTDAQETTESDEEDTSVTGHSDEEPFESDTDSIDEQETDTAEVEEAEEVDSDIPSRSKCIHDVEEVAKEVDGKIEAKDYVLNRKSHHANIAELKQQFEDWSDLLREIDVESSKRTEDYSRQECIEAIQKVASRVGYSPTEKDYDSERDAKNPSSDYIIEEYGEWEDALRDAELL
jgi:hypothetical protein